MPSGRDYKTRRRKPSRYRGWLGLGAVLLLGLGVAGVMYLKTHKLDAPEALASIKPIKKRSRQNEPPEIADPGAPEAPAYAFYDRLPKFEVVVPEKEKDAHPEQKSVPETRKGTYVLQAGTYKRAEDAERIRNKLANQGVQSTIQPVVVDSATWSRIRIGPISNLDELNRKRAILRKADVDVMVIRVGD